MSYPNPAVKFALEFAQVSYRLPPGESGRLLLRECSFRIGSGELVVILGPSGCGKTTLLKLVNRLYEPSSGKVYFQGQDTRQISRTGLRRQIGYVIQAGGLFPHLTVAENVCVVPKLLGWPPQRIQQRLETLLELVKLPLTEFGQRYPAQLSGGQQQRVGIARALAADSPLLLMDEPFGALDDISRRSLQTELLQLQQKLQKTILFVTHDVEEALRLGDRLLILNRGQVVQVDTPLQVLTRPANAFVAELLGAADVLRQLSLVPVAQLLTRNPTRLELPNSLLPKLPLPTVDAETDLRTALMLLLKTGAEHLQITLNGQSLGKLSLSDIQRYTSQLPGSWVN